MRRALVVILAAAAALASLGNPHFASGGAFDVVGPPVWWQPAGALLALAALAAAAALLWRGAAERAFTLFAGEALLYVLLAAASVSRAGDGYFSDGWGGNHFSLFAGALAFRVLLLWLAHRTHVRTRAPAT